MRTNFEAKYSEIPEWYADAITVREESIIALLADGYKNKEIAYMLGISEGTVKVYLYNFTQKHEIQGGRTEVLRLALSGELGIADAD